VWLAANSQFKSDSDLQKYEKARKLKVRARRAAPVGRLSCSELAARGRAGGHHAGARPVPSPLASRRPRRPGLGLPGDPVVASDWAGCENYAAGLPLCLTWTPQRSCGAQPNLAPGAHAS